MYQSFLIAVTLAACWYGLATGRLVRAVLALAVGFCGLTLLLLDLGLGFLAGALLPLAMAPLALMLLLALAQGRIREGRSISRSRRVLAAAAGIGSFLVLSSALSSAVLPVPLTWVPPGVSAALSQALLSHGGASLEWLTIALLTTAVAATPIVLARQRRRRNNEPGRQQDRREESGEPRPLRNREGGSR